MIKPHPFSEENLIQTGRISKSLDEKEQLRKLIDLSPEAIAVHSMSKIIYINQAGSKLFGAKSPKDLFGRSIMDFIHPDYLQIVKKRLKQSYEQDKPTPLSEQKFLRLDGGVIDVEVTSIPFYYENQPSVQTVIRDITQRKKVENQQKILEKISNTLFTSFDNLITLQKIAKLIVPDLADYCRIVILDTNNQIKEIAVSHKDPQKVSLASALFDTYKSRQETTHGVPRILKTGKAEIISIIDEKIYETIKNRPRLLKIIKELNLKSYMGVPLIARKKVIGAITFSSIQPNRFYNKEDLSFVQEVGKRIALALDNSRLYKEAHEELEERKLAQERLREHQERLEITQTSVSLGTFELDVKKNVLHWSPELKALYGLPSDGNITKPRDWEKYIHPDDKKEVIKLIDQQINLGDLLECEFRIVWPDKSVHWIYHKAKVFFDKKRKPIRTVGINIDITQRKQTELNLKFLADASKILASSLDYQTTLNSVAKLSVPEIADWCGIDILDEKGKGLQQVAVAHKDPKKVKWAKELRKKQPVDLNNTSQGVARILKTGKPELYPLITEEMLKTTTRTKRELELARSLNLTSAMIIPLFSEKKPIGAITFITTETRRRYNETDLAIAQELANRASLAIENARLYKGSQEAINMRDDFISIASHELKTPVTSVKIFTQVLQQHSEQIGDKKAFAHLQKMDKQLNKLTELIYNLLNISKIQAGRMEYKEASFNFDGMVNEVVEVLQQSSSKHRLILKGKTSKNVFGDEDRIGQVLSNLISNGVKYSPNADQILINLSTNKNNVVVSVKDFGIGMAKAHLEKIFERFYRVYDTTDKTFPGLGIGLYICSEIIKRHHGKLWVESDAGRGSTFHFSLPIEEKKSIIYD